MALAWMLTPGGTLTLRPLHPFPFHRLSVQGIALAGGRLSVLVDEDGFTVTEAPDGLTVSVGPVRQYVTGQG
jgi:hypothetical protein